MAESGDSIKKLKDVNVESNPNDVKLVEEIFKVKTQVATNSSKFVNKKSLLLASIIMVVYIILSLSYVEKFFHKLTKNENIIKIIYILILFITAYISSVYIPDL
jgi:uncharacterized membrane protein YozB (DUF420 family)